MNRRPIQSRSATRGSAPAGAARMPDAAPLPAPASASASASAPEEAAPAAPRPRRLARLMRHERWFWLLALVTVATVAGWGAWLRPDALVPTMKDIDKAMRESIARKPLASALAMAQAAVAPSVVRVKVEHDAPPADAAPPGAGKSPKRARPESGSGNRIDRYTGPLPPGHPFRDAPGIPGRDQPQAHDGAGPPREPDGRTSLGSGVVVVDDGTILTNLHVVAGNGRISVTFADGTESRADLVSADPRLDLAVLRARTLPDDLRAATLRSTNGLAPGQEVLAIGFPFGIGPSTSAGVVSGLKRRFAAPGSDAPMVGLIQFDAAANPGNSGGPLVTLDGSVVGIVTAIMNPTLHDTFIGIGFAVPIEAAMGAVGMSPF